MNHAPGGIINPLRPVVTDANTLISLPLSGAQPTWRDMLVAASRSKMTQRRQLSASLAAIKRTTGDGNVGNRQGVRGLDPGKLRPLHGAVDFRALSPRISRAGRVLVATRGSGNRCGHRGCHPRLAPKLSPGARYVVTDLNQPMLDYAAARQAPDSRITWRQADALALPFEDAAFDLVCCQFGAMFFPDRVAAYREARRVLKPGGHFLFNVWDRIEENVFADDVTNAARQDFSARSAALSRPHAARLPRYGTDPQRAGDAGFPVW